MEQIKQTPEEEQNTILVLNAFLVGYEFLELLDRIKTLEAYRHGLKQKVQLLVPELEKLVDKMEVLYPVDKGEINILIEDKKKLMLQLAPIRPEDKQGLYILLEEFFRTPELVLYRNGIGYKPKVTVA